MKKGLLQICLLIFIASHAAGQNDDVRIQPVIPDTAGKSFRLFEDEDLLEITLRFDLSTYFRTKPKKEFLKANLTLHLSETDSISRDIRMKTRGIFRNSFCVFAPIELNFKKTDFGYSDLDSITKLKLVTQCKSGSINKEYILKEYLAYKLFNVLTDTSFRVRLLAINYIDTEKKRKPIQHYGIFIEPLEMLTTRTNSYQVKSLNLTQKNIVPYIMDRMAIFNYMIGNYDWSIPGQHNVKIIRPLTIDPSGLGISIPYDFDWTGLVNPSYALPVEETGLESVRERLFTGVCRSREVFLKRLEIFSAKKEDFYRVINESPHLNQRLIRESTLYLDGFFDQLGGRNLVVDDLLNSCKNF
ncbi:MAG: hypothetical protein A2V64_08190 [Bacteroidetes bacterium RBG_13_43_22]|nr:MAG: hypothetical protein A2V64_08190 [Bacteroidetes bacterium RBG_13_43_22]